MAAGLESGYPVRFSVDYPEEGLDRIRTAFRIILALPVLVLVSLIGGGYFDVWTQDQSNVTWALAGGILANPTALMIVVRQKYPRWWFDWNLELLRFSNRVAAYLFLLRDEYPSTDEE